MDDTSHSACESMNKCKCSNAIGPPSHNKCFVKSGTPRRHAFLPSSLEWAQKPVVHYITKTIHQKNLKNMTFHFSSFFWFPKKFGFAFFPHVPSVGKNVTKHPRRMLLPMRRNTRTWRRNSLFFHHLNTNNTTRQYEIIEDTIKHIIEPPLPWFFHGDLEVLFASPRCFLPGSCEPHHGEARSWWEGPPIAG